MPAGRCTERSVILGVLVRPAASPRSRKFAAQDLADVRFRQLAAELDFARALVAGEIRPAMREHVAAAERCCILAHDEKLHRFARLAVRHADCRALEHAGVHRDDAFDFVRIDVEARHEDHVLLSVDDAHEAALVHRADVAGFEVAVGRHGLRGLVGTLPVSCHDLRSLDADLARLTGPHVVARLVAQHDVGRGNRQPDRAVELGRGRAD